MNGKRAFTLIELLLVLLLLGSVMTVVMACFDGGFRVYARVSAFGTGEADIYLAGEVMERDLRNAVDMEGVPFQGDAGVLAFATVVYDGSGEGRPASVRYAMVAGRGVTRSVASLVPVAGGESPAASMEWWLADGYRLVFSYLARGEGDDGDAAAGFVDTWPAGTNLPAAVRFEIAGGRLTEGPIVRTVGVAAPGGGRQP